MVDPGSVADADPPPMRVAGWRCLVCGTELAIGTALPWRCPNSTAWDRHHVLTIVERSDVDTVVDADVGSAVSDVRPHDGAPGDGAPDDDGQAAPTCSFITYDRALAWAAFAEANGVDASARRGLVEDLDAAVAEVAGVGFRPTPFTRSAELSDALGFTDGGGVWVKDETGGVAGSQKARHLFSILLHLSVADRLGLLDGRPSLAIASCGNAALAAATLAAAADWPIDVYVPTWMSDGFGDELDRLGAHVHRCERRASDPPGDPAMLRFREAVAAGAIPFTVQGPENALALDGGRILGWEICDQLVAAGVPSLDRVFVQVGGGAFAASVFRAMGDVCPTRFHAVQVEGCAPLARAWANAGADLEAGADAIGFRWTELMTPWEHPRSLADGILDDETYDWLGIVDAVGGLGDAPIVVAESDIVAAHQLARSAGFDVSPTGSAGLAGLLAAIDGVQPTERVAVVMSGVAR